MRGPATNACFRPKADLTEARTNRRRHLLTTLLLAAQHKGKQFAR
jgi:hypothetical protein